MSQKQLISNLCIIEVQKQVFFEKILSTIWLMVFLLQLNLIEFKSAESTLNKLIINLNKREQELTEMKNNIAKAPTLVAQVLTWEKDSHGLFDYEETKHHKEYFQMQGSCKLFRNWQTSQTCAKSNDQIKRGNLPEEPYSLHFSIILKHNGNLQQFMLGPPQKPSQQIFRSKQSAQQSGPLNTNTYLVVRYCKNQKKIPGYPIQAGDILKFGRVEFKTVQIGGSLKPHKNKKKQESFLKQFQGVHFADDVIQGTCKFCLCDQATQENFLISPCKCSGSCEMVHVQCLKMWINSKVKKEVSGVVTTYNFTKFQCEICKTPFPRKVVRENNPIQMLEIQKPQKPYLILQGMNQRKQSKQQRCLHLLCPQQENSIKIGRGHQCEIRLQDISVSRTHSEIKFIDQNFYLTDLNSKFGTLVRLSKQIQLDHRVKLQAGRSIYEFSAK